MMFDDIYMEFFDEDPEKEEQTDDERLLLDEIDRIFNHCYN